MVSARSARTGPKLPSEGTSILAAGSQVKTIPEGGEASGRRADSSAAEELKDLRFLFSELRVNWLEFELETNKDSLTPIDCGIRQISLSLAMPAGQRSCCALATTLHHAKVNRIAINPYFSMKLLP